MARDGYKVGDIVTFKWRGSGQPYKATTEIGVVSKVYYVAGVSPKTGRGRGYQDRLGVKFLFDHPYPSPGWIYTTWAKYIGTTDRGGYPVNSGEE